MTPDDRWLAAVWPFVRGRLPSSPATVLEIGCGTLGSFVPVLLDGGYQAVGVDPEAPEGLDYRQVGSRATPRRVVESVVASLSLHHVADEVLDRLGALLVPGGTLVVVEWAWEGFDEPTARWCFDRLCPADPRAGPAGCPGTRSGGQPPASLGRVHSDPGPNRRGLHPGAKIVRGLDARFTRHVHAVGPTISLTWPTPPRRRSGPRSTPAIRPGRHPLRRHPTLTLSRSREQRDTS